MMNLIKPILILSVWVVLKRELNPNGLQKVEIFIYDLYGRMVLNPKTNTKSTVKFILYLNLGDT